MRVEIKEDSGFTKKVGKKGEIFMKRSVLLCIFFTVVLGSHKSWAVTLNDKTLGEKLEKIISQSGINKNHLGIYAAMGDGTEVYSLNGGKKMIPASITKLITTAAILNTFKPDHQFKTQILTSGGNLYLKGGADPAFVSEKMWMLVNDFLRAGVKKIKGDLIVDETILDGEKFDKGREAERNDRAYDAPLSGLSFNWNSTTIYVRPAREAGEPAQVFIDPENDYIILKTKVATSKKGTDIQVEREFADGHDVVTVTGKIAVGSEEHHIYKNVTEPALYAGYNLKAFLHQRGVEVEGKVVKGKTPSDADLLSEVSSDRLYQVITSMNKFSNNFIAEMLAKGMAAELSGKQGTMDVAVAKIRDFLKTEVGFEGGSFQLENVSGFTRKNEFSPRQFVSLLTWARDQFSLAPEFMQSLPVAGVDGTLEKRFKGMAGERKVRAKTGLLNGVVALSGYAGRKRGEDIIFAFIFNGNENEAHVRDIFDGLASTLTK